MPSTAAVVLSEAVRSYDKLYDYLVPEELMDRAVPGMRVLVPFGPKNKLQSAWIFKIGNGEKLPRLKKISQIVDKEPLLSHEMIKLAEWMRNRYFCTYGDAVRVMIPAGANLTRQRFVCAIKDQMPADLDETLKPAMQALLDGPVDFSRLENDEGKHKSMMALVDLGLASICETFEQRVNEKTVKAVVPAIEKEAFDALMEEGRVKSIQAVRVMEFLHSEGICALQDLLMIAGVSRGTIRNMADKGWVEYCEIEIERNPFENLAVEKTEAPELTPEQRKILEDILPLLEEEKLNEVLLHGITGSGKTEIYLRLIEAAVKKGKSAIVLVPEISLTPQMASRFTGRFGSRVAIQHSRLSQGERYDQWRKIKNGEVDVVIGARSAVFAPFCKIGVIIADEEHELTYKSENTPKYDARQVARARCNMHGALFVMGSATPSVESYYRALNGKTLLKAMKTRPNALPLPEVELVDLRDELKAGNRGAISKRLEEELLRVRENGEQSILFLNRRGYASFLLCRDCGFALKCPHCSVSLTVHAKDNKAICHYCGYTELIPRQCPSCRSDRIKTFGTGTQRIEEELLRHPANFRVIRMDLDTTSGKQGHQKLLDAFRAKEGDILIGTQMVTKGHDFPDVTLVGILAADASLFNCDFRSSERTFQLITQASGRAGRGSKPGRVILQAYNVDDYAIRTAMAQDYEAFYRQEISMRKAMNSPPFNHIGLIMVSGEDEQAARISLDRLRQAVVGKFGREPGFECSEVMPSPIFVIRGRSRWRVLIKLPSINRLVDLMHEALDGFPKLKEKGTDVSVDIDPASMI